MQDISAKIHKIKLLALDVDGVLTDGSLHISENGEVYKTFNAKDGLGISAAIRNGFIVAIITGRKSGAITKRASELGIIDVYENVKEKDFALAELAQKYKLSLEEVAYMGDDLNDFPALLKAGFSCSPNNAVEEVKNIVDYVTEKSGGAGAVREVIEKILTVKGVWDLIVEGYKEKGLGDKQ